MKENKTIVLFPTIGLPIPSIKGGAIETLITELIDQNEVHGKHKFIVVSALDKECIGLQSKYKYTTFINVKSRPFDSLFLFFYKAIRKITGGRINILFFNRPNHRAFRILKKMCGIDYVICEGGYYRDFLNLSKFFGREKMILHLHHEFTPDGYIERSFSHYLAISDFIARAWKARLVDQESHVEVLRNCINIKRFKKSVGRIDVRDKYKLSGDFVVIFVGRIVPIKGVEQLINAFELANIPNSKLLVVGSVNFGASETSIYEKRIISKAKANGNVVLTGFVHNDELAAYIASSDLMVIPSLCEEGAGLVAIEGLCLNKKMIITKSGGLDEFVDKENCYQIEKNSFFKKEITGDITNEMVLETDWSEFELRLSALIKRAYAENDTRKRKTELFADSFDSSVYYKKFTEIMDGIDAYGKR